MQQKVSLKLLPSDAADDQLIKKALSLSSGIPQERISGFTIHKRSIDARGRQPWINLSLTSFIDEPYHTRDLVPLELQDVKQSKIKVIVIGAGPAGLFAALRLIEHGIKPVVLERGKDVRARRRDLAAINKEGVVNPESNYCFGEGGAGTYSDGKLYTRSTKRGDVHLILSARLYICAKEKKLYEAHTHIETNKYPQITTPLWGKILEQGGKV